MDEKEWLAERFEERRGASALAQRSTRGIPRGAVLDPDVVVRIDAGAGSEQGLTTYTSRSTG
jgi:hypothetical protein